MKSILLALIVVSICSCSKKESPSIIGEWSLERIETSRENGEKLTDKDGELVDVIVDDDPTGVMLISSDNTFSNSNMSGTYIMSANKITFDYGSSKQTADLSFVDGKMKLTYREGGFIIVNYWNRI